MKEQGEYGTRKGRRNGTAFNAEHAENAEGGKGTANRKRQKAMPKGDGGPAFATCGLKPQASSLPLSLPLKRVAGIFSEKVTCPHFFSEFFPCYCAGEGRIYY